MLREGDSWRADTADAVGVVHRREHGVGEAGEVAVELGDLPGPLAQHRVPEGADLERRHHVRVPVALWIPGWRVTPPV